MKTTTDAIARIRSILLEAAPRGATAGSLESLRTSTANTYLSLEVARSFAVSCTVYASLRFGELAEVKDPRLPQRRSTPTLRMPTYTVDVSVSWSSTGRTTAQAVAAVALYQECIAIAAEIDSAFQGETIYSERDLDRADAEAATAAS